MLNYDQTSEIRCAFEEAYIEPGRRRSVRFRQQVDVQLHPWNKGKTGDPVNVAVQDFSANGIGIVHPAPLELGSRFVLRVPRRDAEDMEVLFTVVRRCQIDPKSYSIGLEATALGQPGEQWHLPENKYANTVMSRRVKILFVLLGILSFATCLHISAM
jgi:hypothetical protein